MYRENQSHTWWEGYCQVQTNCSDYIADQTRQYACSLKCLGGRQTISRAKDHQENGPEPAAG
jgi:hypothetical protein